MKQKILTNMVLAGAMGLASQAMATIVVSDGDIVAGPGSGPFYNDAYVEVVAAGGNGCRGGYSAYAHFLDDNHILVDFGNELEADTDYKRIDRKFCALSLKIYNDRGKTAEVNQILGVAKLKANTGAQAEATVSASFLGQRQDLAAEANASRRGSRRKVLKSPSYQSIEQPCYADRPLKIKATVMARKRSRYRGHAEASIPKAVILRLNWKSCYRY